MKREYNFANAKRGSVISVPKGKTRITIRLDEDVLDWFRQQVNRAGGGNYQSLINQALRQHIGRAR
jgi:uncharacterized protein (DUF4415 family)